MPERANERTSMTQWLADSLSADEHVIADFRGYTGPRRWWDLGPTLLLSMLSGIGAWRVYYGSATGRPNLAAAVLVPAAAFGLALGSAALRKIIYVAVTERQIIVVRMRSRSRPARVLVAAPIAALRLTTTDRLGHRTMTCAAADGGALAIDGRYRARLRLRAVGRRSRFDGALAAVRAQGGSVDLPPSPPVPALLGRLVVTVDADAEIADNPVPALDLEIRAARPARVGDVTCAGCWLCSRAVALAGGASSTTTGPRTLAARHNYSGRFEYAHSARRAARTCRLRAWAVRRKARSSPAVPSGGRLVRALPQACRGGRGAWGSATSRRPGCSRPGRPLG